VITTPLAHVPFVQNQMWHTIPSLLELYQSLTLLSDHFQVY